MTAEQYQLGYFRKQTDEAQLFVQSIKKIHTVAFVVLVLTLLTLCRGVHSLRPVLLWQADRRVGRNVERQRASMATPGKT